MHGFVYVSDDWDFFLSNSSLKTVQLKRVAFCYVKKIGLMHAFWGDWYTQSTETYTKSQKKKTETYQIETYICNSIVTDLTNYI
jgi:hypothetical protein